MITVKEKQLAGVIITLSMILSGAVIVDNINQTYYCQTEDSVKEFIRCSSTMITCYDWKGTADRCVNGKWNPINEYLEESEKTTKFIISSRDGDWNCSIKENEKVTSYTKCFQNELESYLGEKV